MRMKEFFMKKATRSVFVTKITEQETRKKPYPPKRREAKERRAEETKYRLAGFVADCRDGL